MSRLYNISYMPGVLVNKYDSKGKLIVSEIATSPITMTALPYATAMRYSHLKNFVLTDYVWENQGPRKSSKKKDHAWAGAATKKVIHPKKSSDDESKPLKAPKSSLQLAAETGDLSAAVNG